MCAAVLAKGVNIDGAVKLVDSIPWLRSTNRVAESALQGSVIISGQSYSALEKTGYNITHRAKPPAAFGIKTGTPTRHLNQSVILAGCCTLTATLVICCHQACKQATLTMCKSSRLGFISSVGTCRKGNEYSSPLNFRMSEKNPRSGFLIIQATKPQSFTQRSPWNSCPCFRAREAPGTKQSYSPTHPSPHVIPCRAAQICRSGGSLGHCKGDR